MSNPRILVAVLAHNEEHRIAGCLESLLSGAEDVAVHVVVNGSSDRTAEIARSYAGIIVHEYAQGGKARSWNRFVLDGGFDAGCWAFVDGDAEIVPGSIEALANCLSEYPTANAATGLPCNGRRAEAYSAEMIATHGLFGDLYALCGDFVRRMRDASIRLPEDLIGDDSLIGAMVKTDLHSEDDWQDTRIVPCPDAGFLCEPNKLSLSGMRAQSGRMVNYSTRHFQNRIVSAIMRSEGPRGLPRQLASLYSEWLPRFTPRVHPYWWWYDRRALSRMACAAGSSPMLA